MYDGEVCLGGGVIHSASACPNPKDLNGSST
jgi:hypothetical protein